MPLRFFIPDKKLPLAFKEALSSLFDSPGKREISDIGFKFGVPFRGRLPFIVTVNGRKAWQCEPSDVYPFLEKLRGWMENCFDFDRNGKIKTDSVTIECLDDVYTIIILHGGWIPFGREPKEPVCALVVLGNRHEEAVLSCFCFSKRLMARLYRAVTGGIMRYRREFNDPGRWFDTGRYDHLDPRDTADRLLEKFCSKKMEKISKMENNSPF